MNKNCLITAQVTLEFSGPFAAPVAVTAYLAKDLNKVVTFQMPSLQGVCGAAPYNFAQTYGAANGWDKLPIEFLPVLEHTAPIWVIKDGVTQNEMGKFRVLLDGGIYVHLKGDFSDYFGTDPSKFNGFHEFSTQWFTA